MGQSSTENALYIVPRTFEEAIVLSVIQGLCSREDYTGNSPGYIAGFALEVANAVVRGQNASKGGVGNG